jgi:hypothetical protein
VCVRSPLANGIALSAGNHSGKQFNHREVKFNWMRLLVLSVGEHVPFLAPGAGVGRIVARNIMGLLIKVQPDLESEYGFDLLLQIVSAVVGM